MQDKYSSLTEGELFGPIIEQESSFAGTLALWTWSGAAFQYWVIGMCGVTILTIAVIALTFMLGHGRTS